MTTKITVDAHAGWPVDVHALDFFRGRVTEKLLATVQPGEVVDFCVWDTRELRVVELRNPLDHGDVVPKPLDFASVIRGLKAGRRFKRAAWPTAMVGLGGAISRDTFVFLVPGSRFVVNREPLLSILGEGTEVDYHGHVDLVTIEGHVVPWSPRQEDMLAEDWLEVTK